MANFRETSLRLLFIVLSTTIFISTISTTAIARDLTGVTTDWAPHYGAKLDNGGPLSVITKEAFKRGGHTVNINFIAWNRAVKNIEEGKDDFVMGAYYNEERAAKFHVTDPIYYLDFGLVALDSLRFDTMDGLESLQPYTIGITLGYANTKEFDEADFLTKEVAPSPKLNIRKLFRNRIDMFIGSFDVARFEALKENMHTSRMVFIQPPLQKNALYLLVSRSVPDGEQLVKDFNRGLASMRLDGTLDDILRQYLGRS